MPLNNSWIDRIFGRLAIRYGAAFVRQWPDLDIDAVKADWADVLDGMPGEAIGYALSYLPDTPPNVSQFKALCNRAPRAEVKQLAAPPADPEGVKRAAKAMSAALEEAASRNGTPAQIVLRGILDRARNTGMNSGQKAFSRTCIKMLHPGDTMRDELARFGVAEPKEAA